MEPEAAADAYSSPEQGEDSGMNGTDDQEAEGDVSAPMGEEAEEEWNTEDPPRSQPSIRYFTPHFRLLPSPGPLAEHANRLALSVSSITGRFWRGAVALAAVPEESSEPVLDLQAVCELPSGVCDLHFVGQRCDRLITGKSQRRFSGNVHPSFSKQQYHNDVLGTGCEASIIIITGTP